MNGVPRSQELVVWTSSTVLQSPVWTTPAGHITLVKSLFIYNFGAAAAEAILLANEPATATSIRIVDETLQANAIFSWEGWFVLNPSAFCYLAAGGPNVGFWLSGAVLAGAPQFAPAAREIVAQLPGPPIEPRPRRKR